MVIGTVMVIAGFSLADTAVELITWISYYDDDTNSKATDSTYEEGAQADIFMHMATAFTATLCSSG